jgi:uncharacterized membrane protein YhaH (DUF805 family)
VHKLLPYLSFAGRANRQRYWLTILGISVLFLFGLVGVAVPGIGPFFAGAMVIFAFWAGLAVAARRLHDRGKSAWWLLPMYAPLTLLSAISQLVAVSNPEDGAVFSALSLPFSLWVLIELGCLKGTAGPNRFGADPLMPSAVEVFS